MTAYTPVFQCISSRKRSSFKEKLSKIHFKTKTFSQEIRNVGDNSWHKRKLCVLQT